MPDLNLRFYSEIIPEVDSFMPPPRPHVFTETLHPFLALEGIVSFLLSSFLYTRVPRSPCSFNCCCVPREMHKQFPCELSTMQTPPSPPCIPLRREEDGFQSVAKCYIFPYRTLRFHVLGVKSKTGLSPLPFYSFHMRCEFLTTPLGIYRLLILFMF